VPAPIFGARSRVEQQPSIDRPGEAPRPVAASVAWDLGDARLYANRELSWLDFNERVLAEALDQGTPLFERVRFLAIAANNLDEFFMIRVSGLKQLVRNGVATRTPDGMNAHEQLAAVEERSRRLLGELARCAEDVLLPLLRDEGVRVSTWSELDATARRQASALFRAKLFPVLTPLAVDPAHPFPFLSNQSLNLAVELRDPEDGELRFARVKVPTQLLSRFVTLRDAGELLPIEELVAAHLEMLFPGMEIVGRHAFRVLRDADLELDEDDAGDLVEELEDALRQRRFRSVVSLVVAPDMPAHLRRLLATELEFELAEVIEMPGLLGLAELKDLLDHVDRPDLRFSPWTPRTPRRLRTCDGEPVDPFAVLRRGDLLVHLPYDSFADSVEALIRAAVDDPAVLAIKQTLYRTTENSSIMANLVRAAEAGKQVVVVVELKARFDEARNIQLARRLENAGAHVVYGVMGLKTHAKTVLVVRREGDAIRRYVHVGTGNYNGTTARLYEDFGLLSCDPALGEDVSELFNLMTGYSRQREFQRLCVAPYGLRDALLGRIARETAHARAGRRARLIMKMNSLVDARMIVALYEASQAGVEIDLIVRGICCLEPGLTGVSERIRVRSLIGRFLEHSRVYYFENDGAPEYLIGSADLMPRNLDRRVEAAVPVVDPALQTELWHVLQLCLDDSRQAWELNGTRWTRVSPRPGAETLATQERLMQDALAAPTLTGISSRR
jgi:polyphosphate kinase